MTSTKCLDLYTPLPFHCLDHKTYQWSHPLLGNPPQCGCHMWMSLNRKEEVKSRCKLCTGLTMAKAFTVVLTSQMIFQMMRTNNWMIGGRVCHLLIRGWVKKCALGGENFLASWGKRDEQHQEQNSPNQGTTYWPVPVPTNGFACTEIGKKAWLLAKLQPGRARKRNNAI